MCLLYDGSTRRITESGFMWFHGFMEKPGIEPATPGLQGIALIHYTILIVINIRPFKKSQMVYCVYKTIHKTI